MWQYGYAGVSPLGRIPYRVRGRNRRKERDKVSARVDSLGQVRFRGEVDSMLRAQLSQVESRALIKSSGEPSRVRCFQYEAWLKPSHVYKRNLTMRESRARRNVGSSLALTLIMAGIAADILVRRLASSRPKPNRT